MEYHHNLLDLFRHETERRPTDYVGTKLGHDILRGHGGFFMAGRASDPARTRRAFAGGFSENIS